MKQYANEALGFEIDIPEEWHIPTTLGPNTLVFNHTPIESLNFVIGTQLPERLLEYTEFEFRHFAHNAGHTELNFGRIAVGRKAHVWARYKMPSGIWAKKYIIVFSGVEYAITASCTDQRILADRESIWDRVVKSFRLTERREQGRAFIDYKRAEAAGELYERAYEEAAMGHYSEAISLLNECLEDNPNHRLAHKELAFILKNTGNLKDALAHREIAKQLDPSDHVNRFNLAGILFMLKESDRALKEIEELLVMDSGNVQFLELRRIVIEQLKK